MDETEGFQCLGGSNWTICSPLSQIHSEHFQTFSLSYWGPILITPEGQLWEKGNSCNFQYGWDRGVSVPGAFKLDQLQPFKPLLFWEISNFFTFILGSQFYYPRGLIMGKGNSPNSRNGWDRGVSVPGAFKLDHLQPFKPILSLIHIWRCRRRG